MLLVYRFYCVAIAKPLEVLFFVHAYVAMAIRYVMHAMAEKSKLLKTFGSDI